MKAVTKDQAERVWVRRPNQMVAFAPNTCPHKSAPPDRWILADRWAVLGTGFSLEQLVELRNMFRRRR